MVTTAVRRPGRLLERGQVLRFHTERFLDALRRFGYDPTRGGLRAALEQWRGRGLRLRSPHTPSKLFGAGLVAEVTRIDVCEMFRGLAGQCGREVAYADLLAQLRPDYFVLNDDADALAGEAGRHLRTLSDGYYGDLRGSWQVYFSLPGVLDCLLRSADQLGPMTPAQRVGVARLASEWIEVAKLSAAFGHADLVRAFWVGRCAAGAAEKECRLHAMRAFALLDHACPIDDEGRPAVSGQVWHRRSLRFDDSRVEASVPKIDRARLLSLHGNGRAETAFAVGQLVLRAGLRLSSRDESRTADAANDLDEARGLLHLGTARTRGYYHLIRHYYHCRRMTARSADRDLLRQAVTEMRRVRRCYLEYLGTDRHLHIAACDIRLAELSPVGVTRSGLLDAVELILSGPFDRSGVADLSGVFDGSSPIYRKVPYDRAAFEQRAIRQRGAYPTAN